MNKDKPSVTLTVTCEKSYLAGFPLLIGIELGNVDPHMVSRLFPFGLFTGYGPVSFVLKGGGREWERPGFAPFAEGEEPFAGSVAFYPNAAFSALEDLSVEWSDVPPGHYLLSAVWLGGGADTEIEPMPIEVRLPSKQDSEIAERLRRGMDKDKKSWTGFVEDSLSTPDVAGLSAAGHAQLDYHLFLHRAVHGPQAIAELNPEAPWKFGHGILEGEAALLRLEILTAKEAPNLVGIEAAIVERWPGLTWRIDRIRKGEGVLKGLRDRATNYPPPPGTPLPYRK